MKYHLRSKYITVGGIINRSFTSSIIYDLRHNLVNI